VDFARSRVEGATKRAPNSPPNRGDVSNTLPCERYGKVEVMSANTIDMS
jgi:hypothetical protein